MNNGKIIELKVISNFDEFESISVDWNRLLESSSYDKVFFTHEWFTAWWQAFGDGKSLFIILAKSRDQVIGIAPLMMQKGIFRGIPVLRIKFIENEDSPGSSFIVRNGCEYVIKDIISFIVRDVKKWNIIMFNNMILDDNTYGLITTFLDKEKNKYIIKNGLNSPYLRCESEWDKYYKGISSKSRKTIRNISNRMDKSGKVEVKEFNSIENFDDIVSITKKGWKYNTKKSFINHDDREKFFRLLSEIAQKKEWLSIWCTYINEIPVAYEYHLRYKNNVTSLLAEFDGEYKNYSPGAYLDYKIIENLFDNGINEYDMCGVQDEYKKKWTNDIRQYKDLIVFNTSLYSKSIYFVEQKVIRLIKKARSKILNFME
jgi:CelD/BcsL family acetyltransferase involved in cellulose biosynthesis